MADKQRRRGGREYEGGAQPVEERPGDQPGAARGPTFLLVAVLAVLSLAMPVAWGIGAIATLGDVLGGAALVGLWLVWGVIVLLFVWSVWALWRGAA